MKMPQPVHSMCHTVGHLICSQVTKQGLYPEERVVRIFGGEKGLDTPIPNVAVLKGKNVSIEDSLKS